MYATSTFIARGLLAATLLAGATIHGGLADPPKAPAEKFDLELIPEPDVEWLKREKVATDDAGLLAFLRSCQGKDVAPAEIEALVDKLMTGTKAEQDESSRNLLAAGTIAVPILRCHRLAANTEAAQRVRDCVAKIEETGDKPLARPAMRRLLIRRPAGVAEALLGFLPFASDPAAEEDVYYGLDSLIDREPKTLALLPGYLKDTQPARRALAACILGRRGNPEQRAAVRELLTDTDALVRLRAAQGLLAGKETSGIATLVELLADPSIEICWQAEELLRWVALDSAPESVVGTSGGRSEARTKCQEAWKNWAKDNTNKIDFRALDEEPRRPLLLLGYHRDDGKLWLFGSDGVTRHEWPKMSKLADAQYVPGGTVLTLHEQPVRGKPLLSERELSGKEIWKHEDMRDPASIQRLSNGRVFVAERQSVDPKFWYQIVAAPGKKVACQPDDRKGLDWLMAVRHLPDGRILAGMVNPAAKDNIAAFCTFDPVTETEQMFSRLGSVRPINVDRVQVEETPDGFLFSRLVVKLRPSEKDVIEKAPDGVRIWTLELPEATHAARLCDRNTIVGDGNRVVVISLDKRIVADAPCEHAPNVTRPILQLVRLGFPTRSGDFDLATAVEARLGGLRSSHARYRRFALERLTEFGAGAAGVLPQIVLCQKDPDPTVRLAAARALVAAGREEIPRLEDELKHADPERRRKALTEFVAYWRAPGVISRIIEVLGDKDPLVRGAAASVLGIDERNPQNRTPSWMKRGALRAHADVIVPALRKLSSDPDEGVRWRAVMSIGKMGTAGKQAVPYLINLFKTETPQVRAGVVQALGHIGPVTDEVLPALYSVMEGPNLELRARAATALGHMRPAAKDTIKHLRAAFVAAKPVHSRQARLVQWQVVGALGRIGDAHSEIVPILVELLQQEEPNDDTTIRFLATRGLMQIGATAAEAIPVLHRLALTTADTSLSGQFKHCALSLEKAVWLAKRGRPSGLPE